MAEKRDKRIQVLLTERQVEGVRKACEMTGWTETGLLRVGLSLVQRILREGRDCCKGGCLAREVLGLLASGGWLERDLRGRSVLAKEVLDTNPPERAGAIAHRMRRPRKPKKVH